MNRSLHQPPCLHAMYSMIDHSGTTGTVPSVEGLQYNFILPLSTDKPRASLSHRYLNRTETISGLDII